MFLAYFSYFIYFLFYLFVRKVKKMKGKTNLTDTPNLIFLFYPLISFGDFSSDGRQSKNNLFLRKRPLEGNTDISLGTEPYKSNIGETSIAWARYKKTLHDLFVGGVVALTLTPLIFGVSQSPRKSPNRLSTSSIQLSPPLSLYTHSLTHSQSSLLSIILADDRTPKFVKVHSDIVPHFLYL